MGETLSIISSGRQLAERVSYVEKRNEILGVKAQNKDERTAEEIIKDTCRDFGIILEGADE